MLYSILIIVLVNTLYLQVEAHIVILVWTMVTYSTENITGDQEKTNLIIDFLLFNISISNSLNGLNDFIL